MQLKKFFKKPNGIPGGIQIEAEKHQMMWENKIISLITLVISFVTLLFVIFK